MGKRVLSILVISMLLSSPICVYAQESVQKATISKTGVDEEARLEAYKEYAAPEADREVDIVPLFEDWNGRKALKKVNDIGNKLLLANNIDKFVRFEVSRKESVNAYASYNGVVHVYKGLLNYVENEDELAYVIGHELGHITSDDNKKTLIRKGVIIAAAVAGGVAVGAGRGSGADGGATAGGIAAAGGLTNRKISRRAEARADISGIDYMVRAGYNPLGAISMINKIMNDRWDGLSTHPSGDKRLMAAYHHIAKNYPKYLTAGFDTISYERAMVVINKKLLEETKDVNIKQSVKTTGKRNEKEKNNKEESL